MSVITVFKEANTLIFSTDSRMMKHDYSGVDSDTQQKIFNLAPETFIATSGRKIASEFQIARARELAIELGTTDIQEIGNALERDSLPCLKVLLQRLRQENDETTRQAVSGQILLHGCTLVGWSCGKLGFVTHSYFVQASGAIKCISESYFDGARKVTCISGTPAHILARIAAKFMYTPATWTDPIEHVSMRFLETVKRVTPTIGGPWQVVRLNSAGSHWISQPPAARGAESDARAAGTCSASILLTAPAIDITTGGVRIQMDATNHLKISNSSTHVVVEVSDANVRVSSSVNSSFTTMTLGGVTVQDASGNWMSINSLHIWRNGSVVL
jgi:hypothetical protein